MSKMYQESVYEGFLTKSPPKMNRKWQRRYFVLTPHKKLLYFSKFNGEQKGIIDLEKVQEVLLDVYICRAQSNIISVDVKGSLDEMGRPGCAGGVDRIYYLLSDSREEMETWHKKICEAAGLQLARKNNVAADSTQGEENYMSARRRTAIEKEEEDRRGLAYSFNPDTGHTSDYGTYNRDTDLCQSTQVGDSYGVYGLQRAPITEIAVSLGEDSGSDENEFTRPDRVNRPKSPNFKQCISTNSSRPPAVSKQNSAVSVLSLPSPLPRPLSSEDVCPSLPPHRQEQLYPEELDFNIPVPPRRVSSQKRLVAPRYPAPTSDDRPRPKERKSVTARLPRSITHNTLNTDVLAELSKDLPSPRKRAAAKTPSIPLNVLITTVKDITPVPRPRRPTSSIDEDSSDTPISPISITPYKTVARGSELFLDPEPIYANDPEDGTYVKFDPKDPLEDADGHYVMVSRNPLDVRKLAKATDPSGYAKIVEPKPRNKMSLPSDERLSTEYK